MVTGVQTCALPIYQWLADAHPVTREQLAEHLTDLAWGGLSSAWPAQPSEEGP